MTTPPHKKALGAPTLWILKHHEEIQSTYGGLQRLFPRFHPVCAFN